MVVRGTHRQFPPNPARPFGHLKRAGANEHTFLEVFSYGPHVTEATFTAIGRLPKNRPDLMRPMILRDLSEVDHGEMALRDFIRLGGNGQ